MSVAFVTAISADQPSLRTSSHSTAKRSPCPVGGIALEPAELGPLRLGRLRRPDRLGFGAATPCEQERDGKEQCPAHPPKSRS